MCKLRIFVTVLFLAFGIGLVGCAQLKQVAIDRSRQYATVEEQVKFLVGEANALLDMEKYDSAMAIGEYILQDLDSNSVEAREIIKSAEAGNEEIAFYETIDPYYYVEGRNDNVRYDWWEIGPYDDHWW